jgi:hypothetical protein
MPSLMEMARWKSLGHADPSLRILGRIAGSRNRKLERIWNKETGRQSLLQLRRWPSGSTSDCGTPAPAARFLCFCLYRVTSLLPCFS